MRLTLSPLLALAAACGPVDVDTARTSSSRAITDGTPGAASDVGSTVSLFSFGDSMCTGTLIARRVVATAAHCLEGVGADEVEVVFGATVASEAPPSMRRPVASLVGHPEYSFFGQPTDDPDGLSDDRDIGVVVLDTPAPSNIPIAPVLRGADVDARLVPDTTELVIAGYGLTEFDGGGDYGRLYVASTPFIRRGLSEILAGRPGSPDTCNGDSGGPAYVDVGGVLHLAGITSRAALSSQAPCGDGGIYTLPGAFEQFLAEASGGLYVAGGDDVDLPPPPPPPEGAGSCANACGDASPDFACFCDDLCEENGDCCLDYRDECVDPPVDEEPVDEEPVDEEPVDEDPVDEDPVDDDEPAVAPANDDGDVVEGAAGCTSAHGDVGVTALALALLVRTRRRVCRPRRA